MEEINRIFPHTPPPEKPQSFQIPHVPRITSVQDMLRQQEQEKRQREVQQKAVVSFISNKRH